MATIRFRLIAFVLPFAAAALAGSAVASVCHPEAAGTRMLPLKGSVRSVAVHGSRVDILVARGRACSRVAWSTVAGPARFRPVGCAAAGAGRPTASTHIGAAALGTDMRHRPVLRLRGSGRVLPLPAFGRSVTVDGGLALVTPTRPDGGVFAVRLRDGAFTYVGPNGRAFAPQLDPRGVVFHDGESKRALREGTTVVKFVPRRAVERRFAETTRPLLADGPIRALSMDGLRVAVAVGDRRGVCDKVVYWNVAWRPEQRISKPSGPTCVPGVAG